MGVRENIIVKIYEAVYDLSHYYSGSMSNTRGNGVWKKKH